MHWLQCSLYHCFVIIFIHEAKVVSLQKIQLSHHLVECNLTQHLFLHKE